MKILLVCAGGMSTGLLMKKMEKYWEERGEDNSINAVGNCANIMKIANKLYAQK